MASDIAEMSTPDSELENPLHASLSKLKWEFEVDVAELTCER